MSQFDRLVLAISALLIVATGVVLAAGDRVGVSVSADALVEGAAPAVTAPVRITFGERMDIASAEAHFSIDPPLEGAITWERNTLVFTPGTPFLPQQTYTVTLKAGAQSATGRRTLDDFAWSFTPRAPRVLYLALEESTPRSLRAAPGDGGEPQELYRADYGIDSFAVSPDGAQVAVAVQTETPTINVWLIDADGSDARQILDCAPDACAQVAWSPDGRLLAYEFWEQGRPLPSRVWLYDMDTGETGPLFDDRQVLGHTPTWSPDGGRLAFFDSAAQAIRVVDLRTRAVALIPTLMGEVGVFAPDGEAMIYAEIRPVGRQYLPELWVAELAGDGGLRPLFSDEGAQDDQRAAWSPDGGWIALGRNRLDEGSATSYRPGRQVMLYNVETGEMRQITDDPQYNNVSFAWDPTGQALLIQRFRLDEAYARPEVWVYDTWDGAMHRIAEGGIQARWQP